MARYQLVVFTDCKPGQEAAFNDWYDNQHLHDVVRIPGMLSAQRLQRAEVPRVRAEMGRFMALYEMETDDPQASWNDLMSRAGTDQMPLCDAIDMEKASFQVFRVLNEPLRAAG